MNKYCFLIVSCLAVIYFSCTNKHKEAQIMRIDGYVESIPNPRDINFNKGDSIIIMSHCNHTKNLCESSIWGIYKGELPKTYQWEEKDHTESNSFEIAVFLKNNND